MVIFSFCLISIFISWRAFASPPLLTYSIIYVTIDSWVIFYCLLSLFPCLLSLFVPCLSAPSCFSPSLPLLFFLQSFFLLKKPGFLSHGVSLHWPWLSMSPRYQLTLSSVPWVHCELVVAPEAWLDAGLIFLAKPYHRWRCALLFRGTRGLAVSLSVTLRLTRGFRSCQPDSSIVKFPVSSSSAVFGAH